MMMTLQQFLEATAGVPVARLRQAMAAALSVEAARTTAEYRRFYRRVLDGLDLGTGRQAQASPMRPGTPGRGATVAPRRATSRRAGGLSTARPCASPP
jgi:hypothetical protein